MENRRQHFRFQFAATRHSIRVRLESTEDDLVLQGEILNLSIGGIGVHVPGISSVPGKFWIAHFTLNPGDVTLSIPVEKVFVRSATGDYCGFRFLQEAQDIAAEERERIIWKFLLDEERRRRRIILGF